MIDFATLQGLTIPEGVVTQVECNGVVLWKLENNKPIVLEVEKQTISTYANETTYNNETFILLDIYPKTNGTVSVTYGGLTKTITDTSGATSPNAQKVFFGTFNGVSDSVTTPTSGTLTIEGDYVAFGTGSFRNLSSSKSDSHLACITNIVEWGDVEYLPSHAFYSCDKLNAVIISESVTNIGASAFRYCSGLTTVTISESVTNIGAYAFNNSSKATYLILSKTPPTLADNTVFDTSYLTSIVVPKSCGDVYKNATYWSEYAKKIVEAS